MLCPFFQVFCFAGPDDTIESPELESSEIEVPGKTRNSFNAGFAPQSTPLLPHKRDIVKRMDVRLTEEAL